MFQHLRILYPTLKCELFPSGQAILIPSSSSESHSVLSNSLQPHRLYSPWNSPGQNTGVGSLSLLQGIFPSQGSNSGLPHCRWIRYRLSHQGSPSLVLVLVKSIHQLGIIAILIIAIFNPLTEDIFPFI